MTTTTKKLFSKMSMNPIDALGNIEELLAAAEVCFCTGDKVVQSVGTELIELARKYANEARADWSENKQ